jgi:hypothetical protein
MEMPSIDFSEIKGMELLPDGWYNASIVSAKPGVSQNKNPKMDLRWKIEGGEHDGRQLFDTLTFSPESLWRVKLTLQALGFPKDFKGAVQPEDLLGLTAAIHVSVESGKQIDPATNEPYPPRNRVDRVRASGGKGVQDLF